MDLKRERTDICHAERMKREAKRTRPRKEENPIFFSLFWSSNKRRSRSWRRREEEKCEESQCSTVLRSIWFWSFGLIRQSVKQFKVVTFGINCFARKTHMLLKLNTFIFVIITYAYLTALFYSLKKEKKNLPLYSFFLVTFDLN